MLVHSADVEDLPPAKAVRLPESIAEKSPKSTVVVTVSGEEILVQGRRVASVADVLADTGDLIEPLKAELDIYRARRVVRAANEQRGRDITILGDKEIPYRLLKKIMVTCVRASYSNISLAVVRKESTG